MKGDIIGAPAHLIPLETLSVIRGTSSDQILALVRSGLLPQPVNGQVPADYLPVEDDPPPGEPASWQGHINRELARYRDGERRVPAMLQPGRERQCEQQLMRMGSAAWGAGLSFLMQSRAAQASRWLDRAALLYRHSLVLAEPGSWGRSIGALKARLLAHDRPGALREAQWTLELGALNTPSVTALYAGALSLIVLCEDALEVAARLRAHDGFPVATANSVAALASDDGNAYRLAITEVLRTFEDRDRYLEDVPVADTVLALQTLATDRGIEVHLASNVLPPEDSLVAGLTAPPNEGAPHGRRRSSRWS